MRTNRIYFWIPIVTLTLILTGCSTTSTFEKIRRLEQDGKYGEVGDAWLKEANLRLEKGTFSSNELENAANNYDRDPERSSDALSARKLAAMRAMKEGEYYEKNFNYEMASSSYSRAADLYKKNWGPKKDLDDISNSEHARLLDIKNEGLYLISGDSKIHDYDLINLLSKYNELIRLISSDKKKVDDYTVRRDSHIKSIRDYIPTANRLAQEIAARKAEKKVMEEKEAIEEKARSERSSRDFAMAIGAATTMLASTQQIKNRSPQNTPSTTYVAPSATNYQPSPTFSNRTGSANPSAVPETSARINVGNASQVGGVGSSNSKFQSKEATHCVEIVPKGFKGCNFKRCIHNACGLDKISVTWTGGGSSGGMSADLAPGQNTSVMSIFDDGSSVRYTACSWDKRAGYSPYSNPCRY